MRLNLFARKTIPLKFSMLFIFLFLGFTSMCNAQIFPSFIVPRSLYVGQEQDLEYTRVPCENYKDYKPVLTKIMLESGFTKPGEIIITDSLVQYRKKKIVLKKVTKVKIVAKKYPGGGITYYVRIVTIDDRFQLETSDGDLAVNAASVFHCMTGLK